MYRFQFMKWFVYDFEYNTVNNNTITTIIITTEFNSIINLQSTLTNITRN